MTTETKHLTIDEIFKSCNYETAELDKIDWYTFFNPNSTPTQPGLTQEDFDNIQKSFQNGVDSIHDSSENLFGAGGETLFGVQNNEHSSS